MDWFLRFFNEVFIGWFLDLLTGGITGFLNAVTGQ